LTLPHTLWPIFRDNLLFLITSLVVQPKSLRFHVDK
jgi:hypothetical protein